MNDRIKQDESPETGFLAIVTHSLLCALGMSTMLFGPLPIILAHTRMPEPWPKVSALLGAIVAMIAFEVPLFPVVLSFVVGLYVANSATRKVGLWRLLAEATAIAGIVGALALAGTSYFHRLSVVAYWNQVIDSALEVMKAQLRWADADLTWETVRNFLYFEGPFLYLSAVLTACWLSIGLAAHLGWWSDKHPYSGKGLRSVAPSRSLSAFFLLFFFGSFFVSVNLQYVWAGVLRFLMVMVFIQGCLFLSSVMKVRGLRHATRGLAYSVLIVLGFYAIVGMGTLSPFVRQNFRKKQKGPQSLRPTTLEGVI